MLWPKIRHIFRAGRLGVYTDGVRWHASPTCTVTSKLKALGGCSSHHLQGAGVCYCGPTAGCTACQDFVTFFLYHVIICNCMTLLIMLYSLSLSLSLSLTLCFVSLSLLIDVTAHAFSCYVSMYNNNNPRTIFIVLLSWPLKVIARVNSVHLMNAAQRTSGCWPSDQFTWLGLWVRL